MFFKIEQNYSFYLEGSIAIEGHTIKFKVSFTPSVKK